ncbi:MAG: hypothetical protein K2O41_06165 [Clostridia bacterium]|nr:hypothetical protein [Clostridia bacterium]
MKRIININISKDTPEETLTALYTALKTGKEKPSLKSSELYLLDEDIEKLHDRYEYLFKQVKTSAHLSETQIQKECETLSLKYDFEVIELSKLRKVEYDNQQAEIKAREAEQKAWRRCWLWRLLFRPLTNRAQDIIEARTKLEADIAHTEAENAIENTRKKLSQDSDKKLSKREARAVLKAVIKRADNANVEEAFAEPQDVPTVQENADTPAAPTNEAKPAQEPPREQLRLDELPPVQTRRPRPPKACRKP